MILLDELQRKRSELKSCETCVTTPGGLIFTEHKQSDGSIVSSVLPSSRSAGYVVDTKPDLEVAWVLPELAFGSQDVALDFFLLTSNCFTHVLSLGIEIPDLDEKFRYKYVELLDLPETQLEDVLENCFGFIDEGRSMGRVYVHCNAGVSRSASVVLAYLMREGRSFNEAMATVKSKRAAARPNDGFVKQLKELETRLQDSKKNVD